MALGASSSTLKTRQCNLLRSGPRLVWRQPRCGLFSHLPDARTRAHPALGRAPRIPAARCPGVIYNPMTRGIWKRSFLPAGFIILLQARKPEGCPLLPRPLPGLGELREQGEPARSPRTVHPKGFPVLPWEAPGMWPCARPGRPGPIPHPARRSRPREVDAGEKDVPVALPAPSTPACSAAPGL